MGLNTTPATWVAASTVTAAQMNTEIRDALTGIQAAWTADGRAATTIWTASTTPPAIGNGTLVSRYLRIGKTFNWQLLITMGSTTTYGSGAWQLTLPFAAFAAYTGDWVGRAYTASGTSGFPISVDLGTTTVLTLRTPATTAGAIDRSVGGAAPITWATGAILSVGGQVEIA